MLAAPAPAALSPTKVLFADSFADDEGPPPPPAKKTILDTDTILDE